MKSIAFFIFLLTTTVAYTQGNLLIITDTDCQIIINGDTQKEMTNGTPTKVQLPFGEHYIQAKKGAVELVEIVTIDDKQQKIIQLDLLDKDNNLRDAAEVPELKKEIDLAPISVANLELKLLGGVYEISDEIEAPQEDKPQFFYAFEAGDEIILNAKIKNKKGKFFIKMYSYPENKLVYSDRKLKNLIDQRIKIKKRGIYVFNIGTTALFDKRVDLSIERQAARPETLDFVTNVIQKYRFETIEVGKSFHYVNSTSHEKFRGGTNEIAVPINIPSDAIEWYYSFSASRSKKEVENNMRKVSLVKQVTKFVSKADPTAFVINIGLDLLLAPPGANYCDVYLLDHYNMKRFRGDRDYVKYIPEGSRENLKSSTIKVSCCMDGQPYYLGIQNDDKINGVHVGIEIVAIKRVPYLERVTN